MCSLEHFKIDLKEVTSEPKALEWTLDDGYFLALENTQVQGGALHVSGSIRKASGFYELQLHTSGTVRITCDRCLDDMDQPIEADADFTVKLGAEPDEEGDVIVVDENEGMLDTAWLIYESVALTIPIKHVHAPGKCNPAMTKALEELSADRSGDAESSHDTDPRWDKLKELKKTTN